ncbi:FAD-dependent oxidoreductase, partial [Myxococcota bacterium]|nr:FAD-dependent oxidoreductase [Myxococcota bacterium]
GRICPETCANSCALGHRGDAIAISWLKRYIADRIPFDSYKQILKADGATVTGKKVAIVGAGPAGLAIAYYLRVAGVESTIFEMMPAGGGMMRYGIPEYRMPKTLLDQEVGFVENLDGVTVKYNTTIGKDITMAQLKKEYDAVVVTVGSWKATGLGVKGDELARGGIVFLEQIALAGWKGADPGRTVVVGGGNTAMDCVRTSVRLGSTDVTCLYRRTRNEMPAQDIEITEAMEEGVNFRFLSAPVGLEKKDGRILLTLIDMELGEPDKSGRRRPQPIEGSESTMEVDTVIAAIGQSTVAPDGVSVNKWGNLTYDPETNLVEDNVFTAGDCATGPATVIEAVGHAKRTAESITQFLAK